MDKFESAIWRPVTGRLWVKVPGASAAAVVRAATEGWRPAFNGEYWFVARGHLSELAYALADQVGSCDVWVDFPAAAAFKCDVRCAEALGWECVCSCLGQNHKGTQVGWLQVGETTLIQPGDADVRRVHYRVFGDSARYELQEAA